MAHCERYRTFHVEKREETVTKTRSSEKSKQIIFPPRTGCEREKFVFSLGSTFLKLRNHFELSQRVKKRGEKLVKKIRSYEKKTASRGCVETLF